MEVVIPEQEFHFNGKTTTPYMNSSFSPKRFACDPFNFHSHSSTAPSSPTAGVCGGGGSCLSPLPITEEDDDFAFDFSGHLDKNAPLLELTTADELFYKGKIRPLKFPLRPCSPDANHRIVAKNSDPFSSSMAEPTRGSRSRNRTPSLSSRSRKGSRSLSPLRKGTNPNNPFPISGKSEEENNISSKKWSFKNLFLFRSASEGRATGDRNKDPLRKHTAACSVGKKGDGGPSPHAVHYAANRAAAEEMKRKTALPYRESFLDWFRYAPALLSFRHSANRGKSMAVSKSLPRLRDGN